MEADSLSRPGAPPGYSTISPEAAGACAGDPSTDRRGRSRKLASFAMVLLSLAISAEAFAFVFLHYVVRIDWSPDYLTSEGQPAALVGLTERDRPPGRPVLLGKDAMRPAAPDSGLRACGGIPPPIFPIGVGKGLRPPRPPTRARGSPAHGSPVVGFLIRSVSSAQGPWEG